MKKRGKKYLAAKAKIEPGKLYPLDEALALVKELSATKFDSSVEVHFSLGIDPKQNEVARGTVNLPHGSGKKIKICVFTSPDKQKAAQKAGADLVGGEELIKEIKQNQRTNFDVAVASPEMMKPLGQIAKILGQRGLMPNPKNETISPQPEKIVKELQGGKITFKSDENGNLHQVIGKVSFEAKNLKENFSVFLEAVKKAKPKDSKGIYLKSVTLASSMGPGIRVQT